MVRLKDEEFYKWLKILSANKMLDLHMTLKIKLSSKQLDYAIDIKNGDEND